MFASTFDVFDALNGLPREIHRPAKRHRRASHPFASSLHPFYQIAACAANDNTTTNSDFAPEVVETDGGYLITALVPGVAADDIEITAVPGDGGRDAWDKLFIRGGVKSPHIVVDLTLPYGNVVDTDAITASCIDGVFRVVVPKQRPEMEVVEVSGETNINSDNADNNADVKTITMDVPGFNHSDIFMTIERPRNVLTITGTSKQFANRRFEKKLKLRGEHDAITAYCANGLLVVAFAAQPPPVPVSVPVASSAPTLPAPADDAYAVGEDEITVLRRVVPGFPASAFTVTAVDSDGRQTLSVRANDSSVNNRRAISFTTNLPARTELSTLQAFVVDGVLTVTSATPLPVEKKVIEVRKDVVAALAVEKNEKSPDAAIEIAAPQNLAAEDEQVPNKVETTNESGKKA